MMDSSPFATASVSKARLDTCRACDRLFKPTMQCKSCGCFMHIKTRLESSTCPEGKW